MISSPTFTMLIGLPGVGKSFEAQKLLHKSSNTILLSSDDIRKELYGDETVQTDPSRVFDLMLKRARIALQNGHNVIYDATNINRKKRTHSLRKLPPCKKVAMIIWAKPETCIANDTARERSVGGDVIKRMLNNFQPPYYDEGFDDINLVIKDETYSKADYGNWMDCSHDNPHHSYNTVAEHTAQVVNEVNRLEIGAESLNKRILLWSAKLHDIGKKATKTFVNSRGVTTEIAHFYNHQSVGSYMALGYAPLDELNYKDKLLIVWLINNHMEPFPFSNSKYYKTLPSDLKTLVDTFHQCDLKGA